MTAKLTGKHRSAGAILTTGDIHRLQAEIARDTKIREEASERIARNKARLDGHDKAVEGRVLRAARPARKTRSTSKAKPPAATVARFQPPPTPQAPIHKFERGGGSYSVVMDILQHAKDGLGASELRRKASEHPNASDSLKKHPSYIYTILDQLKGRKEVERDEKGRWKTTNGVAEAATH